MCWHVQSRHAWVFMERVPVWCNRSGSIRYCCPFLRCSGVLGLQWRLVSKTWIVSEYIWLWTVEKVVQQDETRQYHILFLNICIYLHRSTHDYEYRRTSSLWASNRGWLDSICFYSSGRYICSRNGWLFIDAFFCLVLSISSCDWQEILCSQNLCLIISFTRSNC